MLLRKNNVLCALSRLRHASSSSLHGAAQAYLHSVRENYTALGFERQQAELPSGEIVSYLEKPASVATGAQPGTPLVLLHGLTADPGKTILGCGAMLQVPEDVRCVIPELPGHASRVDYAKAHSIGWSYAGYADDLNHFLNAVDVSSEQKIDLMGFSLGGALVLKFAELHGAARLRHAVLLGPAVALAHERVDDMQRGKIAYAYATADEASEMMECVGAAPSKAAKLGPLFAHLRSQMHGSEAAVSVKEYWTRMWMALANDALGGCFQPQKPSDLDCIPEDVPLLAGARALAAGGVPTLIVQAEGDAVCHPAGARAVAAAFEKRATGSPGGVRCEYVAVGDGFGHYLHATTPGATFLQPGFTEAARFLGYAASAGGSCYPS